MSEFEKLSVPSLKDAFVNAMLERIISGKLKAGDRLPSERELARQMGISRASVNHGILQLESMGFVQVNPRHGTVVLDYMNYQTPQTIYALMSYGSIELSHPIFHDLMETRVLIEKAGASLACENAYDRTLTKMQDEIGKLKKINDVIQFQNSQKDDFPVQISEAMYRFHYKMMQASGNSVYAMIFRGFESLIKVLIRQHYEVHPQDLTEAIDLHQNLLDSIRRKEPEKAEKYAESIIRDGENVLEQGYLKAPEP